MSLITPNYWSRGDGPAVLCLHCSASSSKQFEPLADQLSSRYRVVAIDLYGYGETPMWQGDSPFSLEHEVDLLDGLFSGAREPLFVIGHSYGGAVALAAAMRYPQKIAGLILYEPVLFNLLKSISEGLSAFREIKTVAKRCHQLITIGYPLEAGRAFIDYWSGQGTFDSYSEKIQGRLAAKMPKVLLDFEAVFGARLPLNEIGRINVPAALLYGLDSPAPTRIITGLLARTLPKAEVRGILGMGHMGLASGQELIYGVIGKFLDRLNVGIGDEKAVLVDSNFR